MFDHHSTEPVFNVKAIAHQTGVAAATLRAWERRYGMPSPPRTDSGYRLYSARDVAIIRWLKSQIENGMSISQAVHLLQSVETHATNGYTPGQTPEAKVAHAERPSSYQRLHDDIVAAATEFDEERVERALGEAFSLFAVEDVCLKLVQPVLVTLGSRWHAGEINVSVEHFATNIMRRKLLALMAGAPTAARGERIVSTCAPGEYHEIGILMLSLFLRRAGYNVIYLGQSISATRLVEMLAKTQPDVLLLSASGLLSAANLLEVSDEIRARAGHAGLVITFGGRIFNRLPNLQKRVPGLYVGEDAEQAAERISEMAAGARRTPFAIDLPAGGSRLTEALATFRLRRADVLSIAMRLMEARYGSQLVHARVAEAHQNLTEVVDAIIRFNEPDILSDVSNWKWDAMPPDGIGLPELKACVDTLVEAARTTLPERILAQLQPFLTSLESAFVVTPSTLNKI